jgi:FkbM family methyltransferase
VDTQNDFTSMTNHFVWGIDPNIFHYGSIQLRWYGVLFVSSFFVGLWALERIYRREGKDTSVLENFLMYLIVGAVIGARLAHCLFYEPDFYHFKLLKKNLKINGCKKTKLYNVAVSDSEKTNVPFIRVLGNTTANHIAGSKESPYGELKMTHVNTVAFSEILEWADLVKIDVEGHEAVLLLSTEKKQWENSDALVEVGSYQNAKAIFTHFKQLNINMYSQKNRWRKIETFAEMPISYKEGTLFVSLKNKPF